MSCAQSTSSGGPLRTHQAFAEERGGRSLKTFLPGGMDPNGGLGSNRPLRFKTGALTNYAVRVKDDRGRTITPQRAIRSLHDACRVNWKTFALGSAHGTNTTERQAGPLWHDIASCGGALMHQHYPSRRQSTFQCRGQALVHLTTPPRERHSPPARLVTSLDSSFRLARRAKCLGRGAPYVSNREE
jgi:hypothetical protein